MINDALKLTWADIWVLQALSRCCNESEFNVSKLIAVADATNHAILTSEEFNNAIYRLQKKSLIVVSGKSINLSTKANKLCKKYEKQSVLRQSESIEKELGVLSYSADYNPNKLIVPEKFISKGRFNNAVQCYCKKMGV